MLVSESDSLCIFFNCLESGGGGVLGFGCDGGCEAGVLNPIPIFRGDS